MFKFHYFFFAVANSVFILAVSGVAGIACTQIDIPLLQVYSFIAHLFCSTAINVTNAVTVDIYPTASR